MSGQRRPPRAGASGRLEGPDVNRDRLVFCITSLAGHKVTAMLRNNVIYEGLFHSCCLDGDFSITLKCARRLPSESNNKSGEIIQTLVIPGKDFLQVSAMNLPPPCPRDDSDSRGARTGFQTDGEIARKSERSEDRELMPWAPDGTDALAVGGGLEEAGYQPGQWDQFDANTRQFGLTTSFNEELYTTKLNKESIPKAERDRAERIAKEIMESGTSRTENEEHHLDGDEDEEARFSSVHRGAESRGREGRGNELAVQGKAKSPTAALSPLPERVGELSSIPGDGPKKDGNRKGMITEMKRINALNLEPTIPKDDGSRNVRMNYKDGARGPARAAPVEKDVKQEFIASLNMIQQQAATKEAKKKEQQKGGGTPSQPTTGPGAGSAQGQQLPRKESGGFHNAGELARQSSNTKSSFSFNPAAGEFTPGGAGAAAGTPVAAQGPAHGGAAAAVASAPKQSSGPPFVVPKRDVAHKKLGEVLEPFLQKAMKQSADSASPDWPDAKSGTYKEVLGQPNAQRPQMMLPQQVPGAPVVGPGHMAPQPWQQAPVGDQGQQMAMGGQGAAAPAMMGGQGFCVGAQQNQAQQMYPQMYAAPMPGGPGPQGGQGGQGQGGPGGQQGGQMGGQMQPAMVFNQGGMLQQGHQVVPMGMGMVPGAVGQGMAPMAKAGGFAGQQQMGQPQMMVLVANPGQFQQGFIPQPGMQGIPGGMQGMPQMIGQMPMGQMMQPMQMQGMQNMQNMQSMQGMQNMQGMPQMGMPMQGMQNPGGQPGPQGAPVGPGQQGEGGQGMMGQQMGFRQG